jgi:hypothetical protein
MQSFSRRRRCRCRCFLCYFAASLTLRLVSLRAPARDVEPLSAVLRAKQMVDWDGRKQAVRTTKKTRKRSVEQLLPSSPLRAACERRRKANLCAFHSCVAKNGNTAKQEKTKKKEEVVLGFDFALCLALSSAASRSQGRC